MSGGTHMPAGKRMDAWARRKAKVAEQEAAEARALEARELAAREAAMAEKSDAEICAELGLPDPNGLRPGDDFTAFLKKEVPERLRRLALRKLWRSDPLLANVDGLVDYGEDFTLKQGVGEVMATAYQVGKGYGVPAAEAAEDVVAEMAEAPPQEAAVEAVEVPGAEPEVAAEAEEAAEMAPESEVESGPDLEPEPELQAAPLRRRMRFEFADQETNTI